MAKQRLKTPRELGYNAGLSGETVESHIYVAEFNEADRDEWEAGRKAGAIRKAEHDAEDEAPQVATAPAARDVKVAAAIVKEYLALPIEADGFEVARAVELWLIDFQTPGKMTDGPVPDHRETPEAYGLRFARGLIEYLQKV